MNQEQLEKLLPKAIEWAKSQEKFISLRGIPLSSLQIEDAHQLGIKHPEKIRILHSNTVPFPPGRELQQAIVETGILGNTVKSALFGYGIWLHSDFADNRYLLAAELALLAQCEKLGGIEPFLREYINECIRYESTLCPMELAAGETAEQLCFGSKMKHS